MTVMGLPDTVKFQIAAAYGRVQPSTIPSGAWTDIGAYVDSGSIDRGTNHELQLPNSGQLRLKLTNFDGTLTPNGGGFVNASSKLPNGALEVPIRAIATIGASTYNLFFGYIGSYGPTSFSNPKWYEIELVAYDALKAMQDSAMPASYLGQAYITQGCTVWYATNDVTYTTNSNGAVVSYEAHDSSGNNNNGSYGSITGLNTKPSQGQSPRPVYNLTAQSLSLNTAVCSLTASGTWWFSTLLSLDNSQQLNTALPMLIASQNDGPAGWAIKASYSTTTQKWYPVFSIYSASGALIGSITATTAINPQIVQMAAVKVTGNTATLYVNGSPQGTCTTVGASIPNVAPVVMGTSGPGAGLYSFYQPWYGGAGDIAMGGGSVPSDATVAAWWSYVYPSARTTGAWVTLALANAGPACADQIIDTGMSTVVEPDAGAGSTTSVRSAVEQMVLDEVGQLWVSPNGTVIFRNRLYAVANNTASCTFGTGSSAIPITNAQIEVNDADLWTGVTGQRINGNPIVVDTSAAGTVAGRTGGYGSKIYQYPGQFNHTKDSEVVNLLKWIATKLNGESVRVQSLECRPWVKGKMSNAAWGTLLSLDIWSTVNLVTSASPSGSDSINTTLIVEGIKHEFDFKKGDWKITNQTAPAWNQVTYFMVGSYPVGVYPLAA